MKRKQLASIALSVLLCLGGAERLLADVPSFPGTPTDWHGFEKFVIQVDELSVTVVCPKVVAAGRPWVWHGEFFGHKPAPDIELLKRGFHVVYVSIPNLLGSPPAVEHWNRCYAVLTQQYQFATKAALVGLSRGGLYCYNWAIANPDKVACIYGDAPVCDFKSWPGGKGVGPGSEANWKLVLDLWKFENDDAALQYTGNPVDRLAPLAMAGVPLLHVFGDADEVVPWEENTGLIATRYRELGGSIQLIRKPRVKHHPHGLDDSTPIVEFIQKHATPPVFKTLSTENSVTIYHIESPFQSSPTKVHVIRPEVSDETDARHERSRIVFLLPVEAGEETRWGNPVSEALKHDLTRKHRLIIVSPTFSDLPWYADHPEDAQLQQESYFLETVLPLLRWQLLEARHDQQGYLLLGFSKSGWGAWSLLLRHPDKFARAAAWDAPLMLTSPGKYGSGPIFGTQENFERYCLAKLVKSADSSQFSTSRFISAGYDNFRSEHQEMEALLNAIQVPFDALDGPRREHHWESGWLPEVMESLLQVDSSGSSESK